MSFRHPYIERISGGLREFGRWARQAEIWQLILVAVAALIVIPAIPVLAVLAGVTALMVFGRAWGREFSTLMRLDDGAFPGHHDKLIWAILLIVMPPVGVYHFRSYREAHWPEAKPKATQHEFF
jgi:hypothetical protein